MNKIPELNEAIEKWEEAAEKANSSKKPADIKREELLRLEVDNLSRFT